MGTAATKNRPRGRAWVVIGLLVSLACIVIGIQRIDWPEVSKSFGHVRWEWVALAAVLLSTSFLLFARRWRAILLTQGKFGTGLLFGYLSIGYMINSVLPLRAGDVARAAILRTRHSVTTGVAVASVVIERLLDLLSVVGIGIITAFFIDLPPTVRVSISIFSLACLIGFLGLTVLAVDHPSIKGLRARISRSSPSAMQPFIDRYLRPFLAGFKIMHSPIDFIRVVFWTVVGWVLFLGAMICFLKSLNIELPWMAAAVVVVTTGLGSAIPSSPGALGVYHALMVFALALFHVPTPVAVACALVAHTTTILVQIGLGGLSCAVLGVNWLRAGSEAPDSAEAPQAGG